MYDKQERKKRAKDIVRLRDKFGATFVFIGKKWNINRARASQIYWASKRKDLSTPPIALS